MPASISSPMPGRRIMAILLAAAAGVLPPAVRADAHDTAPGAAPDAAQAQAGGAALPQLKAYEVPPVWLTPIEPLRISEHT